MTIPTGGPTTGILTSIPMKGPMAFPTMDQPPDMGGESASEEGFTMTMTGTEQKN